MAKKTRKPIKYQDVLKIILALGILLFAVFMGPILYYQKGRFLQIFIYVIDIAAAFLLIKSVGEE